MAATVQYYQISKSYNDAERRAFGFVKNERRYLRQRNLRSNIIKERLDEEISPFWIFMTIFGIVAGIGFGIYAAFNAEFALAGIIDPKGEGKIPDSVVRAIGISISIVGMFLGYMIHSVSEKTKRDAITGSYQIPGKLIVLIAAAIIYMCFQVALVYTANLGVDEFFPGAQYLPLVALGIALLELLIGGLILQKAFAYVALFFSVLISWLFIGRMNRNAQLSCESYRRYLKLLDSYNPNNSSNMEREGNNNIRRAIAYYTEHMMQQNDNPENETDSNNRGNDDQNKQNDTDDRSEVLITNPNPNLPVAGGNGNTISSQGSTNHQQDLELFIDDNIDNNLTM